MLLYADDIPQGSILGPLLFLLYGNDMPRAVNSELLLYADDTCLIYMGKNIQKIEEQLNSDFTSLCEWFIDNKLNVHFGEEKTKSILFGTKRQLKDQRDLNLKGELQRENKLISYERAFKMLKNDMYIAGIGQAVLELLSFKVESGNHQRGISLLQKISEIFGNMRLVPLKMTSHLTSHNFKNIKN